MSALPVSHPDAMVGAKPSNTMTALARRMVCLLTAG